MTHTHQYARLLCVEYPTQLAKMNFEQTFDLTAGVYLHFSGINEINKYRRIGKNVDELRFGCVFGFFAIQITSVYVYSFSFYTHCIRLTKKRKGGNFQIFTYFAEHAESTGSFLTHVKMSARY